LQYNAHYLPTNIAILVSYAIEKSNQIDVPCVLEDEVRESDRETNEILLKNQ